MTRLIDMLKACSEELIRQAAIQSRSFDLVQAEQRVKILLKNTRARLETQTEELHRQLELQAREQESEVAAQNAARLALLSDNALSELARAVADRLLAWEEDR